MDHAPAVRYPRDPEDQGMPLREEFARRFVGELDRLGISQTDAAKINGVGQSAFSKTCTGHPSSYAWLSKVERWIAAVGGDPSVLLDPVDAAGVRTPEARDAAAIVDDMPPAARPYAVQALRVLAEAVKGQPTGADAQDLQIVMAASPRARRMAMLMLRADIAEGGGR